MLQKYSDVEIKRTYGNVIDNHTMLILRMSQTSKGDVEKLIKFVEAAYDYTSQCLAVCAYHFATNAKGQYSRALQLKSLTLWAEVLRTDKQLQQIKFTSVSLLDATAETMLSIVLARGMSKKSLKNVTNFFKEQKIKGSEWFQDMSAGIDMNGKDEIISVTPGEWDCSRS